MENEDKIQMQPIIVDKENTLGSVINFLDQTLSVQYKSMDESFGGKLAFLSLTEQD